MTDTWSILKSVVGPENHAQLKISETEKYINGLHPKYEDELEEFLESIRRFARACAGHIQKHTKEEEVEDITELITNENIFSHRTLAYIIKRENLLTFDKSDVVTEARLEIPGLPEISEYSRYPLAIHFMKTIFADEGNKESLTKIYESFRGDISTGNMSYDLRHSLRDSDRKKIEEKKEAFSAKLEERVKKAKAAQLLEHEEFKEAPESQDPQAMFKIGNITFTTSYSQHDDSVWIEASYECNPETCKGKMGSGRIANYTISYAGHTMTKKYAQKDRPLFGEFEIEQAKSTLLTEVASSTADIDLEKKLQKFNLKRGDVSEFREVMGPLYERLNEANRAVKEAEWQLSEKTEPVVNIKLVLPGIKRAHLYVREGAVLDPRGDITTRTVTLNHDGSNYSVTDIIQVRNLENLEKLDEIFN